MTDTKRRFAGINYSAPQTYENLDFEQAVYTNEMLERLKLVLGAYLSSPEHGIVTAQNPSQDQEDEIKPLVVKLNNSDSQKIDVLPGIAVTPSGHVVVINDAVQGIELATTASGGVNIVYLEFSTDSSPQVVSNHWNVSVSVKRIIPADASFIKVVTAIDYANLSAEIKQYTVALAVVNMLPTATSDAIPVIDMSRSNYSFIRPWFSPVDISHRMQRGSGEGGPGNPHYQSLNDFAATQGLRLYEIESATGLIISKDIDVAGVPGFLCEEVIPFESLYQDTTGKITGRVNAWYVLLSAFPIQVGRACPSDINYIYNNYDLAPLHVPGTNIVFFTQTDFMAVNEMLNDGWTRRGVKIWYNRALAGEPPVWFNASKLQFGNPAEKEAIITAGGAYKQLGDDEIDFGDAGPIPLEYTIFVDKDGNLRKFPQILQPLKLITDIAPSVNIPTTLIGNSRIMVALTKAPTGSATTDIQFSIAGRDSNGDSISEVLKFDETYQDTLVPYAPWQETSPAWEGLLSDICNSRQRVYSTLIYSAIDSISIVSTTGATPGSSIVVYAIPDTKNTEEMRGVAPLAKAYWDGYRIAQIHDIRKIRNTLEASDAHFEHIQTLASFLYTQKVDIQLRQASVICESFEHPKLHNLNEVRQTEEATVYSPSGVKGDIPMVSNGIDPQLGVSFPHWWWGDAFPLPEEFYVGRDILVTLEDEIGAVPPWESSFETRKITKKINNNRIEHTGAPFTASLVTDRYRVGILERDSVVSPLHLTQRNQDGLGLYTSRLIPLTTDGLSEVDNFTFLMLPSWKGITIENWTLYPYPSGHPLIAPRNGIDAAGRMQWQLEVRFRLTLLCPDKLLSPWLPVTKTEMDLTDFFSMPVTTKAKAIQFRVFCQSQYIPRGIIIIAEKS